MMDYEHSNKTTLLYMFDCEFESSLFSIIATTFLLKSDIYSFGLVKVG